MTERLVYYTLPPKHLDFPRPSVLFSLVSLLGIMLFVLPLSFIDNTGTKDPTPIPRSMVPSAAPVCVRKADGGQPN